VNQLMDFLLQSQNNKIAKIAIFVWMFLVLFVYLLLLGPNEFSWLMKQIGLFAILQPFRDVLFEFFAASYQG